MENDAIRKTFIYKSVREHASTCPLGEVYIELPKDLVDEFAFKIAVRMLMASLPAAPKSTHPETSRTVDQTLSVE